MENILVGVMAVLVIGMVGLMAWKLSQRRAAASRQKDEDDEFLELTARGRNQDTSYLKVI